MRSTPTLEPPIEGAQPDETLPPPIEPHPPDIVASPGRPARRWRRWALLGAVVALLGGVAAVLFVLMSPTPDIALDSIDAPDSIVEGDVLHVDVHLVNSGNAAGSHDVALLLDGIVVESVTLDVGKNSDAIAPFEVRGLAAGTYLLAVEGVDGLSHEVWVMLPARFVIDDVRLTSSEIMLGESVTVQVDHSNLGETEGSHRLVLRSGSQVIDEMNVDLAGGSSGTVEFVFTPTASGNLPLSLGEVTRRLRVLAPAAFELGGVSVTPNPTNLADGDPVTVTATVSNIGDVEGTETIEFTVDGQVLERRSLTIAGGQRSEETFTFVPSRPGLQTVDVNGTTVELEVYWIERPNNGTVFVNDIGGGSNRLTVKNNQDRDVVVVLTWTDDTIPLLSVYVRANSDTTVRGIAQGTFDTYFVQGQGWCTHYRAFTEYVSHGRFDEQSNFVSGGGRYTVITVTFGAQDGWSPTQSVPPEDFPAW